MDVREVKHTADDVQAASESRSSVTREELYEMVWSAPLSEVAKHFGVAERTIRKICSIHLVPAPPAGYWELGSDREGARSRAKLEQVSNIALQTVTIADKYTRPNGDYVEKVLNEISRGSGPTSKATGKREKGIKRENAVPESRPSELADGGAQRRIAVAAPVTRDARYPEISRFVAELQQRTPECGGFLLLRGVRVPPNNVSRVGAFLRGLAGCLEADGLVFSGGEGRGGRIGFGRDGSLVDFEITFPRQQAMVRSQYSDYLYREYSHVGRMLLHIHGWARGSRKTFTDSPTKTIESEIELIAGSFRLNIAAEVKRDAELNAERDRWAREAKRRELASLRALRDVRRLEFLREVNVARKEADELHATISAIEGGSVESTEVRRMIAWAKSYVKVLEEKTSASGLSAALIERKLFPHPDDLRDLESDP